MYRDKKVKDYFKESEVKILDTIVWIANYNNNTLANKLKHQKLV